MTANSICSRKGTDGIKEVLIKSGAHIAPSDFLSDCMKATQEYCMSFKELECKMTKKMQARCVPNRQMRFNQCFLKL